MMAKLLRGKPVADAIRAKIAVRVERLASSGKTPTLAALRVGERSEDMVYERSLEKAAAKLGIGFESKTYPEDVSESELLRDVEGMGADPLIDGCMLFRPLPVSLDESAICNAIVPSKDVDGVGASSLAGVFMGEREGFAPATAEACVRILDHYGISIEGKHVVVVGRSLVIGKPVGAMMLGRDATVTYCHSHTHDLPSITREADILVCAIGRPRFIGSACLASGQVVLDVGINDDGEGGLCGDVDVTAAERVVDAITPVPGGIGSVSTSILLEHVVDAAERRC